MRGIPSSMYAFGTMIVYFTYRGSWIEDGGVGTVESTASNRGCTGRDLLRKRIMNRS